MGLDRNRQSKQNGIIHEIIDHTFSDSSFTRNHAKRNAVIQIVIATVAFYFSSAYLSNGASKKSYNVTAKSL